MNYIKVNVDETNLQVVRWQTGSLCPNCTNWPTRGNLADALGIDGNGEALILCCNCNAILRVKQWVAVQHSIEQLEERHEPAH